MPDNLTPQGLGLMACFGADGSEGYVIVHLDGSPLTMEEAAVLFRALAAFTNTPMIDPLPIVI